MKHLIFTLTMPHCGSWNGRWSGENSKFVRARSLTNRNYAKLPKNILGSHYYRWDDGWEACVTVEVVDSREKHKRLKNSEGFCGYNWMINSLLLTGKILKEDELHEFLKQKLKDLK